MAHSNTLEISYASQIDGSNFSVSMAFIACLEAPTSSPYSGPQFPTTTQKNIVKMEIDEIRESRRIRKWKEGFGEETETSMGWLSHRLFKPLGVSVSSLRAQATLKLRMMIRTPDPVSDNQDSDAVGLNYTARYSHGSRREAPSETHSRLCK